MHFFVCYCIVRSKRAANLQNTQGPVNEPSYPDGKEQHNLPTDVNDGFRYALDLFLIVFSGSLIMVFSASLIKVFSGSLMTFLNSLIAFPRELPSSGSFPGPKTSSAMTSTPADATAKKVLQTQFISFCELMMTLYSEITTSSITRHQKKLISVFLFITAISDEWDKYPGCDLVKRQCGDQAYSRRRGVWSTESSNGWRWWNFKMIHFRNRKP